MLQSVWFEVTEIDGDGVCTVKSRSVEEDAPVCRWEYWPYWFGVGGDRDGLCIAGSCPAVHGAILVSTASGWTLVMCKWWRFIVLAYTMDYFPQHVRKYEMAGCTLEEADWKSCLAFGVWKAGIIPVKNDRCRFGWFPSSSAFIILSSNSSGLRFRFPHCSVRGFREGVSWEKLFISSQFCSAVVACDPSVLSTGKLSAVCLSLISFDRNLSWSLYTYFPAFEHPASDFVASFFYMTLRNSLGYFPKFLLFLYT